MKVNLIGLLFSMFMGLGVYFGYFIQDEGLNNLGIFTTWFYSIVFFLIIFTKIKEGKSEVKPFVKIIFRTTVFLCIVALSYVAQYIHAAIWLMVFLAKIFETKKDINEGLEDDKNNRRN